MTWWCIFSFPFPSFSHAAKSRARHFPQLCGSWHSGEGDWCVFWFALFPQFEGLLHYFLCNHTSQGKNPVRIYGCETRQKSQEYCSLSEHRERVKKSVHHVTGCANPSGADSHSTLATFWALCSSWVKDEGWHSFHVESQEQASQSPSEPCFDSLTAGWEVHGSCTTAVGGELPHYGWCCSQRCFHAQRPQRALGQLFRNAHAAACKVQP